MFSKIKRQKTVHWSPPWIFMRVVFQANSDSLMRSISWVAEHEVCITSVYFSTAPFSLEIFASFPQVSVYHFHLHLHILRLHFFSFSHSRTLSHNSRLSFYGNLGSSEDCIIMVWFWTADRRNYSKEDCFSRGLHQGWTHNLGWTSLGSYSIRFCTILLLHVPMFQ